MLIPRLDPAAVHHVALDLCALCDQRRKVSPVAESKDEYPVGIDERVILELAKRLPIRGEL